MDVKEDMVVDMEVMEVMDMEDEEETKAEIKQNDILHVDYQSLR